MANLYETYNFFLEIIKNDVNGEIVLKNYKKILIIISPMIPHLSYECMEDLGIIDSVSWPSVDKSKLKDDNIDFVIQLNGKKRGNLLAKVDINKEELLDLIKRDEKFSKPLIGKKINKSFFVKNKLINILIEWEKY